MKEDDGKSIGKTLTLRDFEHHVGDDFAGKLREETVALKLQEVRELGSAMRDGGAFALYFVGPSPALPQATYALRHDTLGELDIFVVPIGRSGDAFFYEAIFT